MKKIVITIVAVTSICSSFAQVPFKTIVVSLSYSIGMNIARSLQQQGVDSIEPYMMVMAINDVFGSRKLAIEDAKANEVIQKYLTEYKAKKNNVNKAASEKFLDENKKRKEVITTASGLQYEILTKGNGAIPKSTDKVTVHYKGTLIDGRKFDSSYDRNQPATFPVTGVIQGWIEALQLMPVGSKWKLYIPSNLAYG